MPTVRLKLSKFQAKGPKEWRSGLTGTPFLFLADCCEDARRIKGTALWDGNSLLNAIADLSAVTGAVC